jgi:hypothetical protein
VHKIIEWIKSHPYETGALVLVAGVAAYFLLSAEQSSAASGSSSSDSDAAADYYSAQLQMDQLSAESAAQTAQINAQEQQSSLGASVDDNEIQAQLDATEDQDTAAIQAAQISAGVTNNQTTAQVQVAQIQAQSGTQQAQIAAGVTNNQTDAQVEENQDNLSAILGLVSGQDQIQEDEIQGQVEDQANNDQTAVDLSGQQYSYLTNTADLQAAVDTQSLNDQTQLASEAESDQYNLANTTLGIVQQAGLNHGTTSLENSLTQITESALGEAGPAEAAAQEGGVEANASAAQNIGETNAIAGATSNVLTSLFA